MADGDSNINNSVAGNPCPLSTGHTNELNTRGRWDSIGDQPGPVEREDRGNGGLPEQLAFPMMRPRGVQLFNGNQSQGDGQAWTAAPEISSETIQQVQGYINGWINESDSEGTLTLRDDSAFMARLASNILRTWSVGGYSERRDLLRGLSDETQEIIYSNVSDEEKVQALVALFEERYPEHLLNQPINN